MAGMDTSTGSRKSERTLKDFADSMKSLATQAKQKNDSNPYGASYSYENPQTILNGDGGITSTIKNARAITSTARETTNAAYNDALDLRGRAQTQDIYAQQRSDAAKFNQGERDRFNQVQQQNAQNSMQEQLARNSEIANQNISRGGTSIITGGGVMQTIRPDGRIEQIRMYDPETVNRDHQQKMATLGIQGEIAKNDSIAKNQRLSEQAQQAAQQRLATTQQESQERLARINQQTSILASGVSESTWRWF